MKQRLYTLRFWGVRGSVPTPSQETFRFGGNTSCLAAALGEDEYLILDCGTGLRFLGRELAGLKSGMPHRYQIFLSHYHYDHIQGLPFFQPLYDAKSHITFYGFGFEGKSVQEILQTFMTPPYFPVRLAGVPARVDHLDARELPVTLGDVRVSCLPLNHPNGSLSYRLEHGHRRIVFATDHEYGDQATDQALIHFSEGADHLIYDATYQPREYEMLRRGWGHSTWYAAVQTARAARVKNLLLFHHHPDHTDRDLDEILRVARKEFPNTEVAGEGMTLDF